jgi:hypothetical protein
MVALYPALEAHMVKAQLALAVCMVAAEVAVVLAMALATPVKAQLVTRLKGTHHGTT